MCCAAPSVSAASTTRPASSTRCAAASGAFAASSMHRARVDRTSGRSPVACDRCCDASCTTRLRHRPRPPRRCRRADTPADASARRHRSPPRRVPTDDRPLSVSALAEADAEPHLAGGDARQPFILQCLGRAVHEGERRHHDAAGERRERRGGAQRLRRHRGIHARQARRRRSAPAPAGRAGRVRPGCPTTPASKPLPVSAWRRSASIVTRSASRPRSESANSRCSSVSANSIRPSRPSARAAGRGRVPR